jgi:hypothetical protein
MTNKYTENQLNSMVLNRHNIVAIKAKIDEDIAKEAHDELRIADAIKDEER